MYNELSYEALPQADCEEIVFPLTRTIEKLRWWWRAEKYRQQEDRGGIRFIREQVHAGDTVFDIGAHKGGYLYHLLQQTGDAGKVYAFEPQCMLHGYLRKLQNHFRLQQLVIERLAVSDRNGQARLGIPHNGRQHSSPCASLISEPPYPNFQLIETVATIALDDYCFTRDLKPSFLKVDVEGHEWQVFSGARELLHTYKPRLLFECELRFAGLEKMKHTFRLLQNAGYRGYFIRGKDLHPIAQFDVTRHQDMYKGEYCNNFVFE